MPGYLTDGMPGVPAAYVFTGNEQIPVDTLLPAGQNPQTFAMPLYAMGFPVPVFNTPLNGDTITVLAPTTDLNLTPAGTIAGATVVFPKGTFNGQRFRIFSTQIVTTLTCTPATGDTITGNTTTLAANVAQSFIYNATTSAWVRNG